MNPVALAPARPPDGSCVTGSSEPSVAIRKTRILVADDEEGIRCLSSLILAGDGFDVNVSADGEQAWDALSHEPYDLLLTDNDMPRLTGMKLIERIRQAGMQLPVILASGSLPTASTLEHLQLQISEVLLKPFTTPELMAAVRGALQHKATFPNTPLPAAVPHPNASKMVHHRILIADDDALVRGSLAAVLEYEDFAVDEAQNGIEAVTRAITHTPDLVLLDLNMPLWDGWTAFSKLDRVSPLLPVIVITARPNQYPRAVQLGVDAFMEKPLNIPILVRAIKRLTSEDESRHMRRITDRAFVTELLGYTGS
jgi:DNA-binding response OmpR family regulator